MSPSISGPTTNVSATKQLQATFFVLLALVVALLSISSLVVSGAPGTSATSENTVSVQGAQVSAYAPYSDNWRIGFGFDQASGHTLDEYDVSKLCAGWYHDWGTHKNPIRPNGMDYVQTLRVSAAHFNLYAPNTYDWDGLEQRLLANPGSVWVIGNEPDGVVPGACDNRTPTEYAQIYKIFYDHIKSVDATAQVSNGSIIQGTVLRMQWLTKTWDEYQRLYGQNWPVDIWSMHNQMVKEAPFEGADIPPGCDPALGANIGIQDNDNLELFITHVRRMRQWMKDHGQQAKALYITEYGVLQPAVEGFTVDRINLYMTRTFTYLLNAKDESLGMAADGNRLVQRWNWFALNTPLGHLGTDGAWNGNLFNPETRQITEFGLNYAKFASGAHPTPTPSSNPASRISVREAEGGSLYGAMGVQAVSSASDCRYVLQVPGGTTSSDPSAVAFNFYATNTGYYSLFARGWGADAINRSISVKVGAYAWETLYFSVGSWNWQRASGSYYLEGRRWHTVQIGPRLDGTTRVDMLVLTDDSGYQPSQHPELVQPCIPTATPTLTRTSTPLPTATPTITRTPMPIGPAGISGQVAYQGRGMAPSSAWAGPLLVTAHLPGDPVPAYQFGVNSDAQGHFTVATGIKVGTYDVGVRNLHSLRNMYSSVLLDGDTPAMDMSVLVEGDANIDNTVNIIDFSRLASVFDTTNLVADFNADGKVDILDFSLLAANFDEQGDRILTKVQSTGGTLNGSLKQGTVSVRVVPASQTASVGGQFTVDVYAYAGSTLFDGVECRLYFDPTYLEVLSITPGTALELALATSINADNVRFARGTLSPKSGTVHLFTLSVRAKATVASTALDLRDLIVSYGLSGALPSAAVDGVVLIPASTATPTPTITLTPSQTPIYTAVPQPTATRPADPGIVEVVFRQGLNGYSGFEDTYISDWSREENYEGDWSLQLRSLNAKSILVRADLASLPADITIDEAVLTLYGTGGSNNPIQSQLYGVTRTWNVLETTWISATQTVRWAQMGCGAPGIDRDAAIASTRSVFPTHGSFATYPFDFRVTSLVQRWVDDPATNYGLLITSLEGPSAEFAFLASESSPEAYRPRLMVRYHVGSPYTPTPTVTGTPPTATPTATQNATPSATPMPTTSVLSAIKDAYIDEWFPANNYGGHDSMLVRAGGVQRGLVQFGMAAIPQGATIYSAKLRLYNLTVGKPTISISAYGLKKDWGEYQTTWQKATEAVAWTEYGAKSVTGDRDDVAQDTKVVSNQGWYEWNVTELVQRWSQSAAADHGILLVGNEGVSTVYNLASRHYGVGSYHPELVVEWQVIVPTATPTPTATATMTPAPGGTVQGYVYIDRNSNSVFDAGEGIGGGTAEIRGLDNPGFVETRVSAADGSYSFVDVEPGGYALRLIVPPAGYLWRDAGSPYIITVNSSATSEVDFEVYRPEPPSGLYLPMIISK